jgi:hypothetical protein
MDDYMKKFTENLLKSEKINLSYLIKHGRKEEAESLKIRIKKYEEKLGMK